MPLTKEDRIALLAKARAAKKEKADAKKAEKAANPPPKGRPRKAKIVDDTNTLELELPEPEPEPPAELEPEVEEIIEVRKIPKKKKIVRKRVIQEYESGTDEEVEEVVEAPVRRTKLSSSMKTPVEKPVDLQPREVDITQSTPQFNFFGN